MTDYELVKYAFLACNGQCVVCAKPLEHPCCDVGKLPEHIRREVDTALREIGHRSTARALEILKKKLGFIKHIHRVK